MSLSKNLRKLWHDLYYVRTTGRSVEFAMRCKDVTAIADLGTRPKTWMGRLRLRLHLSLCQACHDYFETTKALKAALNNFVNQTQQPDRLNKLNQDLLKKYAHTSNSKK